MKDERIRRAERVLTMRNKVLEGARLELARAERQLHDAEKNVNVAENFLHRQVSAAGEAFSLEVGELQETYNHIESLSRALANARSEVTDASKHVEERRRAIVKGTLEVRRVETWRDNLVTNLKEVQRADERRTEDEFAARIARAG